MFRRTYISIQEMGDNAKNLGSIVFFMSFECFFIVVYLIYSNFIIINFSAYGSDDEHLYKTKLERHPLTFYVIYYTIT